MKEKKLQNLKPRELSRKMDVTSAQRSPSPAVTAVMCITFPCR